MRVEQEARVVLRRADRALEDRLGWILSAEIIRWQTYLLLG